MKRFRFGLEAVLRLREYREQLAEIELAQVLARQNQYRQQEAELAALQDLMLHEPGSLQSGGEIAQSWQALSAARAHAAELADALQPQVSRAAQAYQQQYADSEALRRLRAHREADHNREERKSQDRELGELAGVNWIRERSAGNG